MKQNKYFSLKRFYNLMRNDWLINYKAYLFTVIGFAIGIYGYAYFFMTTTRHFTNNQYTGLFAFFLMGIGVFIGTSFPALSGQVKTIHYLLSPGSTFEKYLVQFVSRMMFFIPLSLLIFWIATYLAKASLIPDPVTGFDPTTQIEDFHFWNLFSSNVKTLDRYALIMAIFSCACFLFAGSAYFKRFAFVKTLIVFALVIAVGLLLSNILSHVFFPSVAPGMTPWLPVYEIWKDINNYELFWYLLYGISWLFFLPLAYFKLKEKEV